MTERLSNGHDKSEEIIVAVDVAGVAPMHTGSIVMQQQIAIIQTAVARQSERATIEALAQDAVRRLADAYKANDWQRAAEITREICRLEVYLSKRPMAGQVTKGQPWNFCPWRSHEQKPVCKPG
jgi:hypothetical protein